MIAIAGVKAIDKINPIKNLQPKIRANAPPRKQTITK